MASGLTECAVKMNSFEIKILDFIRDNLSCRPLDVFFKYFTELGGVEVMVALILVLLMIKKTRHIGITAAIALIMGIVFSNFVLKIIVDRIRPYEFNTAVSLVTAPEKDSSFPSGHSMSSIAMSLSVFFYNKKAGAVAIVAAVLIVFSRAYLYLHYPSDVLTGAFIGVLSAIAAKYITEKLLQKFPKL